MYEMQIVWWEELGKSGGIIELQEVEWWACVRGRNMIRWESAAAWNAGDDVHVSVRLAAVDQNYFSSLENQALKK